MPIFAPKRKEEEARIEPPPEVPTAEELKKIAERIREGIAGKEKSTEEIEELAKKAEEREEKEEEKEKKPPPEEEKEIVGPPLFIKLEKYHKILKIVAEIRRVILTLKTVVSTLIEIQKLNEDNLKLFKKSIEKLDSKLAELDKELLRPREIPLITGGEAGGAGVESLLTDLRTHLKALRDELETLV